MKHVYNCIVSHNHHLPSFVIGQLSLGSLLGTLPAMIPMKQKLHVSDVSDVSYRKYLIFTMTSKLGYEDFICTTVYN